MQREEKKKLKVLFQVNLPLVIIKSKMRFIILAILFKIFVQLKCELYTSFLHMSQLVQTQFEITKILKKYLNTQDEERNSP